MDEKLERLYKILVEEQFITTDTLDTFKNRLENEKGYADSVADVAISEELYIGDKKNFEVEYFSELKEGKKSGGSDKDKEKIVSRFDVEDPDLFDEQTINDKFDPYIDLLKTEGYTNTDVKTETQRLAKLAEVESLKKENLDLLKVDGAQDKIKAANLLKRIEASTIPSDEEIALEVERNQKEYLESKSDKKEYVEKKSGAVSDYIIGLENNDINFLNLPTDENITSTQAELSGGIVDIDLSSSATWGDEEPKRSIAATPLPITLDEVKESEKSIAKEEFKEMTTQLKNGAEASGLKVTNNFEEAQKSNGKLFYLPKLQDFEKDPNVILNIDRNPEVFQKAKEIVVKNTLVKEKLQSKKVRDEIDEVLSTFEDEQGVSVLNDIVKFGIKINPVTGVPAFIAENFFDADIDEIVFKGTSLEKSSRTAYKQNKKT
uniref:Uncharacterized protein n=1 Tax=uncultured marine virus TaxID=186617 RepID=A0A0F7LBD7_9VIRU|nr:hypothetical protein [uncultured marine virus]